MNCYERLTDTAGKLGLCVIEKEFKSSAKGLCKGNKIGISKSLEDVKEKRCILAEEMAHAFFTAGNILDQSDVSNIKQEHFARGQAYEALIPLSLLIDAYTQGYESRYEIAEYLEVTEEFLINSLWHYLNKYGIYKQHGNYTICFSPLSIIDNNHENQRNVASF